MQNQSFEALEARLQALQRQVIMLVVVFAIILVCLLGTWVFKSIWNPVIVRARALEIVDKDGRCIMGMHATGYYDYLYAPHLQHLEMPVFWMADKKGRIRVEFAIDDSGDPIMALKDELGRATVVLRSLNSGNPGLSFFNSSGVLLFSAP
jgi:hypothetical protein